MKKNMLAVILIVICSFVTFAQEKGVIEFGGNLGVNFSRVSDGDGDVADSRTAFNIGASGEYYFSNRWGIKAKLIYDSKGWANAFITNVHTGVTTDTDFKLNYITIPVMANWHFGATRKWYLNFGPYIGFLASAKDSELKEDIKEAFKATDFGFAYGIGYKFSVSEKLKMYVEYENESGFSDISEDNFGGSVRTHRGALNLGILMRLK